MSIRYNGNVFDIPERPAGVEDDSEEAPTEFATADPNLEAKDNNYILLQSNEALTGPQ